MFHSNLQILNNTMTYVPKFYTEVMHAASTGDGWPQVLQLLHKMRQDIERWDNRSVLEWGVKAWVLFFRVWLVFAGFGFINHSTVLYNCMYLLTPLKQTGHKINHGRSTSVFFTLVKSRTTRRANQWPWQLKILKLLPDILPRLFHYIFITL